jgi:predicted O-methyltransferase YrrM
MSDWQYELDSVKKYIKNDFIYDIFKRYGFLIDGVFIKLNSNINVYEACFISLVTENYLKSYKSDKKNFNILEIGFAYGTSAIIFFNQYKNYSYDKNYDIIDMNQTQYWKNIGEKNLKNFMNYEKINLKYNLYEEDSTKILPKLKNLYDIIFIDGGHSYEVVIQDLYNSDKLLKFSGIMIIDDILHKEVKDALLKFLSKKKNYKKLKIVYKDDKINLDIDKSKNNGIYNKENQKRDFFNPNSMYALIKL